MNLIQSSFRESRYCGRVLTCSGDQLDALRQHAYLVGCPGQMRRIFVVGLARVDAACWVVSLELEVNDINNHLTCDRISHALRLASQPSIPIVDTRERW